MASSSPLASWCSVPWSSSQRKRRPSLLLLPSPLVLESTEQLLGSLSGPFCWQVARIYPGNGSWVPFMQQPCLLSLSPTREMWVLEFPALTPSSLDPQRRLECHSKGPTSRRGQALEGKPFRIQRSCLGASQSEALLSFSHQLLPWFPPQYLFQCTVDSSSWEKRN